MYEYTKPSHQEERIDDEVRLLMKLAGTMPVDKIATILKMPPDRVTSKAVRQGISLKVKL